ncbi:MAG: alpha/beta hydrolase [Salibacteraceae bacterium]
MAKHRFKGVDILFETHGKGPATVLIHGFLESKWMWKEFVPVLAQRNRIVLIDLPGHGQSDNIGYVHQMSEMAECVKSVLDSLKVRKATLVGHSMGGYVALAFAEMFPDNIRKLILYQSTARDDSKEKKRDRLRAMKLIKQNHKSFIRQSIPMLFRPKNRTRFRSEINALKSEALKTSRQGIIAAIAGMKDRPNREIILKFAPYPIHIIAGDYDPRIPLSECIEQSQLSSTVSLHIIEGVGHMSYIEAEHETIELFRKLLK